MRCPIVTLSPGHSQLFVVSREEVGRGGGGSGTRWHVMVELYPR